MFVTSNNQEIARVSKDTFCEKGNLPQVIMVLVDATETIDPVQSERAISALMREVENSPKRARIDVFYTRPQGKTLVQPLFSKCNPGLAKSGIYSDAAAATKRFSEDYVDALEDAFSEAIGQKPANTSPILESIRAASTRSFSRVPNTTERRIILISDMLQHSDIESHYKQIGNFREFKASSGWPKAIVDLGNSEVRIMYITRSKARKLQGREHQAWWESYFLAVHGRLIGMESY